MWDNQPLLWTGPRRVAGHRASSSSATSREHMAEGSPSPIDYATPPRLQCHAVTPAAAVDPSAIVEAGRRYVSLRRQAWRRMWHLLACLAAVLIPQMPFGAFLGNTARGALAAPFLVACLICWARAIGNAVAIAGFECPRCGLRFGASKYARPGQERCKHCGLDLGPVVTAAT